MFVRIHIHVITCNIKSDMLYLLSFNHLYYDLLTGDMFVMY